MISRTDGGTVTDNFTDVFHQPGAAVATPFQTQDLAAMKTLLDQINASGAAVTKTLVSGFASATSSGKTFNDVLANAAQSLAKLALKSGTQSLTQGLVGGLGSLFSGAFGGDTPVAPFADGGVVASPTFFGNGASVGLMGERGAEAILPLARGPNGQLGVAAQQGQSPVAITVNIAAQDVNSFRQSEAQITGALARAVARGQRNL
jgi:phage-related minor tail protein